MIKLPARVLSALKSCVLAGALALGPHVLTVPATAAENITHGQDAQGAHSVGPAVDTPSYKDAPGPPNTVGWMVTDLDSGQVLASWEPHAKHSVASVIKPLTALALLPHLPEPSETVTATEADASVDGTRVGLMPGNPYTIDQLLHAMLMGSANDAAHALGEAVGGQDVAREIMQAKAVELGMVNTTVGTTSGLDYDGQGTTSSDLMHLAVAFLDNEYLSQIVATQTFNIPSSTNHETGAEVPGFEITNRTRIVGTVDGGIGLKNGYTKAARGSILAVAERDGHRLAAAVVSAESGYREAATELLEWGFAHLDTPPVETMDLALPLPPPATPSTTPTPSHETRAPASDSEQAARQSFAGAGFASPWLIALSFFGMLLVSVVALRARVIIRQRRRRQRKQRARLLLLGAEPALAETRSLAASPNRAEPIRTDAGTVPNDGPSPNEPPHRMDRHRKPASPHTRTQPHTRD